MHAIGGNEAPQRRPERAGGRHGARLAPVPQWRLVLRLLWVQDRAFQTYQVLPGACQAAFDGGGGGFSSTNPITQSSGEYESCYATQTIV